MQQYECIARALVAWGGFVVATALVSLAVAAAPDVFAGGDPAARFARAVVVLVVVLAVLAALHRRRRGDLGLSRPGQALTGVLAVAMPAAVVFGADHLAGGTTVTAVDVPALLGFVALTLAVTAVQEAVPEELALRGSAFGSLREAVGTLPAAVGTTVLFVLAPGAGITIGALLGDVLGLPTDGPSLAPAGQDPVAYVVLLVLFGTMLVTARIATGSTWACVGAHLTFLLVNRLFVTPADGTGLTVRSPDGVELLVPAYLLLATGVLVAIGLRRRAVIRRTAASAG